VKDLPKSFFSPKESIWNLSNIISIQKHHLGVFMLRSSTQFSFKGLKKVLLNFGAHNWNHMVFFFKKKEKYNYNK
jgi:hypothetical protein